MKKLKELTKFDPETTKNVETIRAAWGVEQSVRGEKLPRWWRSKKYDPIRAFGVFDHIGRIGETIISEPYFDEHNEDLIARARKIAEEYDLEFTFSLMSWHYPGKTIRLTWIPKDLA